MKDTLKISSALCGLVALVSIVMGLRALTGHSWYIDLAMFSMIRRGTALGFAGNIICMALTALGFGSMAVFGLTKTKSDDKKGFAWGIIMTGLCVLSFICSIFARTFNMGDVILLILPAVYTVAILKNA